MAEESTGILELPKDVVLSAASDASLPDRSEGETAFSPYTVDVDKTVLAGVRESLPPNILRWLDELPPLHFEGPITLVVGDNGSGKSTLAEAILLAQEAAFRKSNPTGRCAGLNRSQDTPALKLAPVLVAGGQNGKSGFGAYKIHGAEAMTQTHDWAKGQSQMPQGERAVTESGGRYTHERSTRQLMDEALTDLQRYVIEPRRRIAKTVHGIFDEPEAGLDLNRQTKLPGMLAELMQPGDSLLVPTNNAVLVLSDLPRIDLNQPDRGVHVPTQEERISMLRRMFPQMV